MTKYCTIILSTALLLITITNQVEAQLKMPASSPEAEVSQRVGITDITIHYSRPYKKGRTIWGELVPYGFNDLNFGTSKSAPWRAGADYNTTIEFTHDVSIQGNNVPAGKYGLFMAVEANDDVMVILSSNTTSWGSYFYKEEEDVLRFNVKANANAETTEMLTFSFDTVDEKSATASLKWGDKEIPFTIDVDVTGIVMADIERNLRNPVGFEQSTWDEAAAYAFDAGNDDKALEWVNGSISGNFFSKENFSNLSLKSEILEKKGMTSEASTFLEKAIPLGTATEIYRLGAKHMNNGNLDKALEIMKANVMNSDGAFPSNYGLARVYSAQKDFTNAIESMENSLKAAPSNYTTRFTKYLDQLKAGEDINPK